MIDLHIRLNEAEFAGLAALIHKKNGYVVDHAQKEQLENALRKTALECDNRTREDFLNHLMEDSGLLSRLLTYFSEEINSEPEFPASLEIYKPISEASPGETGIQLSKEVEWNGQCSSTHQSCSLAILLKYLLEISDDWAVNIRELKESSGILLSNPIREGDIELELRNSTGEVLYVLVNTRNTPEQAIRALSTE